MEKLPAQKFRFQTQTAEGGILAAALVELSKHLTRTYTMRNSRAMIG
jgi:hypothetical protein